MASAEALAAIGFLLMSMESKHFVVWWQTSVEAVAEQVDEVADEPKVLVLVAQPKARFHDEVNAIRRTMTHGQEALMYSFLKYLLGQNDQMIFNSSTSSMGKKRCQ